MIKVYNKDVNSIFYNYRINENNYDISEYDNYRKLIAMISSMMVFNLNIFPYIEDCKINNDEICDIFIYKYLSNFNDFNIYEYDEYKIKETISKLKNELKEAIENNNFTYRCNGGIDKYITKLININNTDNFLKSIKIIFQRFYDNKLNIMNNIMNNDYSDYDNKLWVNESLF